VFIKPGSENFLSHGLKGRSVARCPRPRFLKL